MKRRNLRNEARLVIYLLTCAFLKLSIASPAMAFKPEDPQVRAMVDRGVKYLESLDEKELLLADWGGANGQVVLAAYAHFKAEHNPDVPLVKLGLQYAQKYVESVRKNKGKLTHDTKINYEASIAILLMAEVDSSVYGEDIELLGNALLNLQNSNGGYSYQGNQDGDTSQVQYVVLAMWTLDRAGIDFPLQRTKAVLEWICRVQDPTGYWPYLGVDPGINKAPIKQPTHELSISTCLAAGGALLIASDIFKVWGSVVDKETPKGFPKAIKPVVDESELEKRRKILGKKPAEILSYTQKMEQYRSRNPFKRTGGQDWYYYLIYSMERYESFLELAMGTSSTGGGEPWYDQGVTELMKLQGSNGSWGTKDQNWTRPPVSTSFAILFLIRSTKKSIVTKSRGSLTGGYGLPKDTSEINVKGSQIVAKPVAGAVDDLLGLLEEDEADQMDAQSIPEDLKLEKDPKRRQAQLDRLSRLVRGSKSWQARRVAARLLGSSDSMEVVPSLVFALSDPDSVVRLNAFNGLKFISRQFDFEALPDKPTAGDTRAAQQAWAAWYKKIFPDFDFSQVGL